MTYKSHRRKKKKSRLDTSRFIVKRKPINRLPALSNIQMDWFMDHFFPNSGYINCLSKDQVGELSIQKCCAIVNSGNSNEPTMDDSGNIVRHWTCFSTIDPNYAVIFDSFGVYSNEQVKKYCLDSAKKFNQKVIYSDSQYQNLNSSACGWFCLYVLIHLFGGYPYAEIVSQFTEARSKLDRNEEKLYRYFKPYLKIMQEVDL